MVDGWWTGGRGRGRAEKRLFNGRISEIVRTYICWQIYESAFLLKWGKLLRRRGCCCCCPWLWGCNGAGERGNTLLVAAGVLLLLLLLVVCCCCCCCCWWIPGEGGGETYALHPSRSRSCAFACSWFFHPANSPPPFRYPSTTSNPPPSPKDLSDSFFLLLHRPEQLTFLSFSPPFPSVSLLCLCLTSV